MSFVENTMKTLWNHLEAWAQKVGAGALKLRRPATEQQIARVEEQMGRAFPADFRESLLAHDGQDDDPDFDPGTDPFTRQ